MWLFIFAGMALSTIGGLAYLISRFYKFHFVRGTKRDKLWNILIAILILVVLCAIFLPIFKLWSFMTAVIHVLVFWLICDFVEHRRKKRADKTEEGDTLKESKVYIPGIVAIAISVLYLSVGWYYAHHVYRTEYTITAQKDLGVDSLKIVGFADSHLGSNFHWQEFEKYAEAMSAENPDIVVVVGDYVDNDSVREDMVKCAEALGTIKAKYGVYYVFGNHDANNYGLKMDFDEADLRKALTDNHVQILEDDVLELPGNIRLIGRKDRTSKDHKEMAALMQEVDDTAYTVVLDHQPTDYKKQMAAGVDLVISGHTHAGQLIPINMFGEWFGLNDKTYGLEMRGETNFLVTSGISDWAIKFRTGCIAEYFVINLENAK